MSFLLVVIIAQFVAILAVSWILKVVLEHMLIDIAIRHIEAWKLMEAKKIREIVFVSHKRLKRSYVDRIQRAARAFSPDVHIDFRIQKALWGGAVVRVGEQVFDCSLKTRVLEAFGRG